MTNLHSMQRLKPGIYHDGAGGLHIDVTEMLRANGWPDTPANRDAIEQAARDMFGTIEVHDRATN